MRILQTVFLKYFRLVIKNRTVNKKCFQIIMKNAKINGYLNLNTNALYNKYGHASMFVAKIKIGIILYLIYCRVVSLSQQ